MDTKTGYVHVYTGDGKGKTTAAFGLALRACGAGMKVRIIQFMKPGPSSEMKILEKIPGIVCTRFGASGFVGKTPSGEDRRAAADGFAAARKALSEGPYGLVILDELVTAMKFGLLTMTDIDAIIAVRPPDVELVLTGRDAPRELVDRADLVTEMRCVKHYYDKGAGARPGIEF